MKRNIPENLTNYDLAAWSPFYLAKKSAFSRTRLSIFGNKIRCNLKFSEFVISEIIHNLTFEILAKKWW